MPVPKWMHMTCRLRVGVTCSPIKTDTGAQMDACDLQPGICRVGISNDAERGGTGNEAGDYSALY